MRRKLLLADDSITVQRVIELTFADEDLEVATVGDGGQAIAWIERDRPDIVLADLSMPVRDGYGVTEHVKRTAALAARTRVVLLTGAFELVDQERAELLGVDGVLAKPFEPRRAIALVRELLEKPPKPAAPRSGKTGGDGAPAARDAFDPGASGGARSTPAELDDYFARLDEALASAGLVASPAVRDMLAESKAGRERDGKAAAGALPAGKPAAVNGGADPRSTGAADESTLTGGASRTSDAKQTAGAQPRDGMAAAARADDVAAPTDKAAPGTGGAAPGVVAALASLAGAVKETKTQMSAVSPGVPAGTPGAAPASGTLVDAFSALLAAEQGETVTAHAASGTAASGTAGAAGAAGEASQPASVTSPASARDLASGGAVALTTTSSATNSAAPGASVTDLAAAISAAGITPEAVAAALPLSDALLDALARRIVDQVGERLVRDLVNAHVVDIAERLVREEIERLKAAAEQA